MSRRRVRSPAYRARRQQRHATRHYVIDEPLPNRGRRVTEYRRGRIVAVDIDPGPRCEGCGYVIDPDCCGCGSSLEGHGWGDGHPFVPMGCACFRSS